MAKARKEVTPEEKYAEAEGYIRMAEELDGHYLWKEDYYNRAIRLLRAVSEQFEDAEKKIHRIRLTLFEIRARYVIEAHDKAAELQQKAESEEEYTAAAEKFREIEAYRQEHRINEDYIPGELKEPLAACSDCAERAGACEAAIREFRGSRSRKTRVKGLIAAVLVILVVIFVRSPYFNVAVGHAEELIGDHTRAWQRYKHAWEETGSERYKTLYQTTRYQDGINALESGDLTTAYEDFKKMSQEENYEDSVAYFVKTEMAMVRTTEIGELVTFGSQEWRVLDRDGDRTLLVKRTVCEDHAFRADDENWTWDTCEGRQWLNGEFLTANFMPEEIERIETTSLKAEASLITGEVSGSDTEDQMFLLSASEVLKYQDVLTESKRCWWTRTPGSTEGTEVFVDGQKFVMAYGYSSDDSEIRLKPACWVNTAE